MRNFGPRSHPRLAGSLGAACMLVCALASRGVAGPSLEFASRFGGVGVDSVADLAVDDRGNVHVTGSTTSTDFSAPPGEGPRLFGSGGGADAYVLKLSADGSTILFSTLLGGAGFDEGLGIAVDLDGNVYVAGGTSFVDSGFPSTESAYRTSAADFFVSKLDPSGELVYSTFIGGRNIGRFGGLAIHGSGDLARVYVVGSSLPGFPTTPDAYRRGAQGGSDVFLAVLEPAQVEPADQLVYSTMFGSTSGGDTALGVAVGQTGHAYIAGNTQTAGLPLRHAFDRDPGRGREAFLAVIDPLRAGDEGLLYSTYIGGSGEENGSIGHGGVAVGPEGVALVTGSTSSTDFPVKPFVRVSRQLSDAYLVVVDPSLPGADSLLYGAYLGGSHADDGMAVAAGPRGIAYVGGRTQSQAMPGGAGAPAPKFGPGTPGAGGDAFIIKIDWTRPVDESLIDAVYLGGAGLDIATGIAVDASGSAIIAGETTSEEPFSPPAFGSRDGLVSGVRTCTQLPDGVVGTNSLDVLDASFGKAPHRWAIASGTPPDGLALSGDGTLSGVPTEVGLSTFTVEITDAVDVLRRRSYRKRIGTGASSGEVSIRKVGQTPVPGRVLSYRILVRNLSARTLYNVEIVELLEPWFEFISSTPLTTQIEPRPGGNVYWTLPRLIPGELELITYRVRLPAGFPLGVDVTGEACPNADDCGQQKADCLKAGKERCSPSCGPIFSSPECIQCNREEAERCEREYQDCLANAGRDPGSCDGDRRPTGRPVDPNQKDVSTARFFSPGEVLGYTIHFENIGDVEARDVFLTDALDEDLDLASVRVARRLGGLMPLEPDTTISIFDDDEEEWTAHLDSESRTITWELLNVDLPPGETDNVYFVVQAPEDLPTGTEIRNEAGIRFEIFETLTTNETLNTVDTSPPTGSVDPLPSETFTEEFEVSWSGIDPVGEIERFLVYASTNDGPFTLLAHSATASSIRFTGELGNRYGFLCVARDTAGNLEDTEDVAETSTLITMPAALAFRRGDANHDGTVDVSDGIRIVNRLFLGGEPFACEDAADANDDRSTDVSDAITVFGFLFLGGSPPPAPGPRECGLDPSEDALTCLEDSPCR